MQCRISLGLTNHRSGAGKSCLAPSGRRKSRGPQTQGGVSLCPGLICEASAGQIDWRFVASETRNPKSMPEQRRAGLRAKTPSWLRPMRSAAALGFLRASFATSWSTFRVFKPIGWTAPFATQFVEEPDKQADTAFSIASACLASSRSCRPPPTPSLSEPRSPCGNPA